MPYVRTERSISNAPSQTSALSHPQAASVSQSDSPFPPQRQSVWRPIHSSRSSPKHFAALQDFLRMQANIAAQSPTPTSPPALGSVSLGLAPLMSPLTHTNQLSHSAAKSLNENLTEFHRTNHSFPPLSSNAARYQQQLATLLQAFSGNPGGNAPSMPTAYVPLPALGTTENPNAEQRALWRTFLPDSNFSREITPLRENNAP